jgi:hypothetical protein
MSSLSWVTGEIELRSVAPTSAEIEQVINHPRVQISFVHEYVHVLQLVTSVGGIRLLEDLIDLGVRGGLLMSGAIALGDVVQGYRRIHPLLEGLDRFAWRSHPGVEERRNETMDELEVMLRRGACSGGLQAARSAPRRAAMTQHPCGSPAAGTLVGQRRAKCALTATRRALASGFATGT